MLVKEEKFDENDNPIEEGKEQENEPNEDKGVPVEIQPDPR